MSEENTKAVMITDVAIRQDENIYSLPRPARHHHVIWYMGMPLDEGGLGLPIPIEGEQGFLTNTGEFVDRKQAKIIAQQCGQILPGREERSDELFSEDVWETQGPDMSSGKSPHTLRVTYSCIHSRSR